MGHGDGGRRERAWYREPETFIALAALVVSVSAVVVGMYEAALQRRHDRAEVWPHLEIEVFTKPSGAAIYLENTGIGPAIVHRIVVHVDGKPATGWPSVIASLLGHAAPSFSNTTVLEHGLRAGDRVTLIDLPNEAVPRPFWPAIRRVGMNICYSSVFNEHWTIDAPQLGGPLRWQPAARCAAQPRNMSF